ncbi:MAG TPA: FkbM family methyltransferase [Allocoleopsis sp.]
MVCQFTFRPGTIDQVVFRTVYEQNEYRVPEHLAATDVVIDIGAHIGSFAYLCWLRGSRQVFAFEADPENARLAQQNLKETNVNLKQAAVWRSDVKAGGMLFHGGYAEMLPDGPDPVGVNTGGGNVFAEAGTPVPTVSLDEIIGDRQVRMLKVDCEGSEFPILLTSQKLRNCACVIGEYHLIKDVPSIAQVNGSEFYTVGLLADMFVAQRFRVEFVPYKDPRFPHVGNFYAYNLDWQD